MRILIILVLSVFLNQLYGQKSTGTTAVVDSLNQEAFASKRSDISKALNLLIIAQITAQQIDYQKGLAIAYLNEGGIYQQQGFNKRALTDYYLSLDIFKRTKDTFNLAKVTQQIGNALLLEGRYDTAVTVFNECLSIFKQYNKEEEIVNVKNSLGLIQLYRDKPDSAVILFDQALNISKKIKYSYGEKKALYHLGKLALNGKNLDLAVSFFNASMAIDQKINDRYGMALNNLALADIALKRGLLNEMYALSKTSYEFAK